MKQALRPQLAQDKPQRRLGLYFFVPVVLIVAALFVFARNWRSELAIETVSVEGAKILPAKDVVGMAAIQPRCLMNQADLFDARQRLLQQPYVKSAVVTRLLPHTLKIQIVEREPIAAVQGSELRYIDSEAVLIPRYAAAAQFDLPVISGVGGIDSAVCGVPQTDTDLVAALDVVKAGQTSGFAHIMSEVHVAPGEDIVMYPADAGIPVLLGRGDMDRKLAMLKTFWTGYMPPDTLAQMQYIDARFDGQVVVKRNPARMAAPPRKTNS